MSQLELVPITQKEAHDWITRVHRTHEPPRGGKFYIAVALDGAIVGVGVAGRPLSRVLDDGWTLEATRVATDGTRNACSKLYGAIMRAGKAMGYRRFVTYTLPDEGGSSLRAAGWRLDGEVRGDRTWNTPARPRVESDPNQYKLRWMVP